MNKEEFEEITKDYEDKIISQFKYVGKLSKKNNENIQRLHERKKKLDYFKSHGKYMPIAGLFNKVISEKSKQRKRVIGKLEKQTDELEGTIGPKGRNWVNECNSLHKMMDKYSITAEKYGMEKEAKKRLARIDATYSIHGKPSERSITRYNQLYGNDDGLTDKVLPVVLFFCLVLSIFSSMISITGNTISNLNTKIFLLLEQSFLS